MQTSEDTTSWHRLHWSMLLFGLGSVIRGAIFPIVIFGYAAKSWGLLLFIIFTGVILPLIAQVMKFISLRYQLAESHIRIREGIFSRKIRSIPVRRIHNINTSQSLPARLFNVLRLDIETAGGDAAEASFVALSRPAAMEIQDFVRVEKGRSHTGDVSQEEEQPERVLFRISMKDLLIAGATTNRMGLILVGLGVAFQYWEEYASEKSPEWIKIGISKFQELAGQGTVNLVMMFMSGLILLFLVAWIISIFTALISWHKFTVSDAGEDLKIKTGLFTVRGFTMPRNKIQALRFKISPSEGPSHSWKLKFAPQGMLECRKAKELSPISLPLSHGLKRPMVLFKLYGPMQTGMGLNGCPFTSSPANVNFAFYLPW